MEDKQSLIAEARREQIILASINILADIGYNNTSLSKIAKKANLSTGLLSYHFSGKEDLMRNTLTHLVKRENTFIKEKVKHGRTYTEKLLAFIEAGIAYRGMNRENNSALLEIVFNGRTPDNVPYYMVEIDTDEELNVILTDILIKGQENKEFKEIDPQVVTLMIRGAITVSMSLSQNESNLSLESYSEKMKEHVLKMLR